MQKRDRIGDAGNERSNSKTISADVEAVLARAGEVFSDAVSLVIGHRQLPYGDLQPDMAEKLEWGYAVMGDFIDVESELDLYVLVPGLGVVDHRAVLGSELGELDGNSDVGGAGVANCVSDVMGERANGKGQCIGVFCIAEEAYDEVAGADVVSQIGIDHVAEWVIADVLDDATAVGVGAGLFELGSSQGRIAAEQQRDDRVSPGEVDELLVSQQRICVRAARPGQRQQQEQHSQCRQPDELHRLLILVEGVRNE